MTDIPGTGKIEGKVKPDVSNPKIEDITIVNVKELKKGRVDNLEDTSRKSNLNVWITLGIGVSIVFALMGFVNKGFLILVPLGPTAVYVSWKVKNFVEKMERKNKKLDSGGSSPPIV
ncbi:hypothetical protein A2962_02975 [Candidatus Woesebacteria bacterium RIFCSPLOWO2_01_FULL_39_61]|uniref:Uncharacterized protein n=1 Tax=Candidatus Woesebacteria bacterium RIFCSPHIGHO2_02_FULL_39_13 TaxID=1802505 RepID=A0A1F7Z0F9_9BACT|nr:MAG: hypothetical protein A2692_04105 [Candidatus Woesebacteria bacterium RIFCSPHIGHO2_01_FULL_39_95]OGM33017.1 MAG: hypothetical protein A3D01_04185 [Candidatus Woesebacteria bacterium RIFCSPHIGHO2_02_FULL_39_13]OGM37876.1 MAG: hypothetical protein A3E13_04080 [Candidatus Woesebacteria bacterium RIFCSPHIGHO2_12_FULL_40_20]OGM66449.1 MAG: hypothetical protein A2962_02975 [Candidatus Woesebacteria bacterium RIFCSPLOWO2_01_FULL_39_61]OGM74812.1 MAG: hypothetical protein A3H19_01745 [Candidatus